MKTILLLLVFLNASLFVSAKDRQGNTHCPTFNGTQASHNYHPMKSHRSPLSHRAQVRKHTPSSCRKKRRTGEVQRFLKIQ